MPNTASAKKALRQNKTRRARKKKYQSKIKDLVKRGLILARENKEDDLKNLLPSIYKALDKAVKAGVIKKNTASRRKSLLARKLARSPGGA